MLAPNMATFTSSDGVRMAYRIDDFGQPWRESPTPVLMLHAAMGRYRRWYGWIPTIAQRFPTISLELRGHGSSEVPPASLPWGWCYTAGRRTYARAWPLAPRSRCSPR